jgi:hypothetical protein
MIISYLKDEDNGVNNKYLILTAMYRYEILPKEDKPSLDQIKDLLTTINPHTMFPGSKLIVKKSLRDNFGITKQQEIAPVLDELIHYAIADGIIYSALIDLYLHAPEQFASMSREKAAVYICSGKKMKGYIKPFAPLWEQFQLAKDPGDRKDKIKTSILEFFQRENDGERQILFGLFKKNKCWLSLTKGRSIAGFNLSRIISILSDATMVGFLPEKEAEELLNHYGTVMEALFDDWQTFLSSAVFGKQLMSAVSGNFILDSTSYVESCYKLAAHQGKLLEISGLWPESDMTEFCRCISEGYGFGLDESESNTGESEPRYAFSHSKVLPVLRKYGVSYLLDQEVCELSYTVPVSDISSGSFYDMEALAKKKKFQHGPDEIPFIAHSRLLVTDRFIRLFEKKLFGSKLHVLPWTQKLQFSYDLTKLDLIAFKVNGMTMFHMPRNYKKAGISKKDDGYLDKDKVIEYYSEDIKNAISAFSELNRVLGNKAYS